MALINQNDFSRLDKEKNSVHKPVKATFTSFRIGGKEYFQIDTYGSEERAIKGKCSQSIMMDEEMARTLIEKLNEVFGF